MLKFLKNLKNKKPKQLFWAFILLTILISVVVGVLSDDRDSNKKDNYTYSNTVTTRIAGSSLGLGIKVTAPDTLVPSSQTASNTQMTYVKFDEKDGKQTPTSFMALKSASNGDLGNRYGEYAKAVSDMVNNPKNLSYEGLLNDLSQLVQDSVKDPGVVIKIDGLKEFKNLNINENAWQYDVSLKGLNNKTNLEEQSGKIVYILTKNGSYFVFLSDTKENWQKHQSLFKTVFDSIEVDQ